MFTSAGPTTPLETTEAAKEHSSADEEKRADKRTHSDTASPGAHTVPAATTKLESGGCPSKVVENEAEELFYYDTGKATERRGNADTNPSAAIEAALSDGTSSSEEVILFKGRSRIQAPVDYISLTYTEVGTEAEREPEGDKAKRSKTDKRRNKQNPKAPPRRSRTKKGSQQSATQDDDEDTMLADYIANMRNSGELDHLLGLTLDDNWSSEDSRSNSSVETDEVRSIGTPADGNFEASQNKHSASPNSQNKKRRLSSNPPEMLEPSRAIHTPNTDEGLLWNGDLDATDNTAFDPMDWERPSLRRRKGKGSKAKLNLQFADLDLETEQRLQSAWKSDRLKKAERKRNRERARTAGLLGKKADPDDLRIRYPTGMSIEEVAGEVKQFLVKADDRSATAPPPTFDRQLTFLPSLCFPPMGKNVRKLIHELANKLSIKSKSIGKGDQRRPILYRTNRTEPFNAAIFDQLIGRVNRRYFPRLNLKSQGSPRQAAGRNGYAAAASYRDGEVVGAAAPELGVENRGRAMLEKMGWSSGTALGATENKGILLPVTQTMKRSKAGLG